MIRLTSLFCIIAIAITSSSLLADTKLPFKPGEKLLYKISYSKIISAGKGLLEVRTHPEPSLNNTIYEFIIQGRSVGLIGKLYPIEDITKSVFDIKTMLEIRSNINIRENDYRKTKELKFNRATDEVEYKADSNPVETFKVKSDTQGPFSILYLLRANMDRLVNKKELTFSVFDAGKLYDMKLKYIGKKMIKLKLGKVDTYEVNASLKTDGVFRNKGKITVWISADESHVPIKVRTKLLIGSIYSTLDEFHNVEIKFESDTIR
ncbi:MAG: DUF3108 domain-containing protein [Nitrospinota bacterium]